MAGSGRESLIRSEELWWPGTATGPVLRWVRDCFWFGSASKTFRAAHRFSPAPYTVPYRLLFPFTPVLL